MRFALLLVSFVGFLAATGCDRTPTNVTDDTGKVSISFPGKYGKPVQSMNDGITMHVATSRHAEIGFMHIPQPLPVDPTLVAQETAREVNASVVETKTGKRGKFTTCTIYYRHTFKGTRVFTRHEFFFGNGRMYQIIAGSDKESNIRSADIDAFFDSVQFK